MEEQLITFKTAKLAKEKDFEDWGAYTPYWFHIKTKESTLDGDMLLNEMQNYIQRPTQSLLQKWFRDVHGIVIAVDINNEDNYFLSITNIGMFGRYKSWETALEKGLQKALKLI